MGLGMTPLTIIPNNPPAEFLPLILKNLSLLIWTSLFLSESCSTRRQNNGTIELADETATWPFWVPYATKPMDQEKRRGAGPVSWLE